MVTKAKDWVLVERAELDTLLAAANHWAEDQRLERGHIRRDQQDRDLEETIERVNARLRIYGN